MSNPINGELVLRKVWSEDDQALRTVPSSNTSFSIELSHSDGDTVETHPQSLLVSDTTETACLGIKSITLYLEAATGASAKVQVSPKDSGDVWMDVASSTVTSSPSAVTASSLLTICARRIRVVTVSGSPVAHLVGQAV